MISQNENPEISATAAAGGDSADPWDNEILLALLMGDRVLMFTKFAEVEQIRTDPLAAARRARLHATELCGHIEPGLEEQASARRVLDEDCATDEIAREVLANGDARDAFARKVLAVEHAVFRVLRDAPELTTIDDAVRTEPTPAGSVLWADAAAATVLEGIGHAGRQARATLLSQAARRAVRVRLGHGGQPGHAPATGELWRLWVPRSAVIGAVRYAPLLDYVTRSVWLDVFRPQWVRVRRPMVWRPVHRRLRDVLRPGGRIEDERGEAVLVDRRGNPLTALESRNESGSAVLVPREVQDRLRVGGTRALASVAAHRFLFRATRRAREQQAVGMRRPEDLVFRGRWTELAEWLDLPRKGDSVDLVRDLVLMLSRLPVQFAAGKGQGWTSSLLAVTDFEVGRGELVITLLGPMRADISDRVWGADRNLVPLLEPPPVVGSNRGYSHELALLTSFVGVLDERRMELAERGSVAVPVRGVPGATWHRLAEQVGLDRNQVATLLLAWERDNVLCTPESDRWTLGGRYSDALEALVEGGKRSRRRQAAGRRGAHLRRCRSKNGAVGDPTSPARRP